MTIVLEVQKAARQANCRSVLHYHGSPYGYLRKYIYREDIIANPLNIFKLLWSRIVYPFKKAKLRKVITNATGGFVCVSEGVRKELLELCSLPGNLEKNIWSIPNPLTFDRNETINLQKKYMVVYISRLHRKHKNSMMAVKAWALIEKKFPGWQLYILGDGVLRSAMEKFCTQHQLLHVHFTGMVSNVKEYVRDSSVSILTSDCEGLGMGLLESASYKNALLVTNADGGVSDIVVDGSTGFMVERNDVKLFAERLSTLMSDELLRKKMGDAAFKRLENFDDAVIVARWMQLLKPII
jgi:glycosyltransferase involved in cell wall biosynthesis